LSLPEVETRLLSRPASSLDAIHTEQPMNLLVTVQKSHLSSETHV
jgi:hypothetical protein